jgi:membrane-bound serine protease (ClpP class)
LLHVTNKGGVTVRKGIIVLVVILLFAGFSIAPPQVQPATDGEIVYIVPLDGPVEAGLQRFLQRSFLEAEQAGATAIILELNTPGGRVDSASDIRDLIFDSPVPVYAYVRYSAISAGAFLALAGQEFYMAPGSSIGAAELRSMTGEEVDEKEISYWEGQMKTVAERQGKDPQVAAAMVRQEIEIEGLVNDRTLLTLTAHQAEEIGFTDGIFNTRSELLVHLGYADATQVMVDQSPAERLARFITNPNVATILISIGMAALVIEIMTAGFGVAGSISILAFALFFGGHIFAGFAGQEVVILFVLGVVLLLIEAVIPNFGIFGLSGMAAIVTSIVLSVGDTGLGLRMVVIALFLTAIIIMASLRFLKRTGLWSQIVLQFSETIDQGYVGPANLSHLVGKDGITITSLRPSGTAEIEGKRIDVVSEGGFVAQGATVTVTFVEGTRVVVRHQ